MSVHDPDLTGKVSDGAWLPRQHPAGKVCSEFSKETIVNAMAATA
jgi:hypothetical protein